MPTYEAISSTNITAGTSSASITGFSGYFGLRIIFVGSSNSDVRLRFNNSTDTSRYSQYNTRITASPAISSTYYNSTFSGSILIGDSATTNNQSFFSVIDIFNYSSTSPSPPRAKQGFARTGSNDGVNSAGYTYWTGFSFYDTDNPISSLQFISGGTFQGTTTVSLYGIG